MDPTTGVAIAVVVAVVAVGGWLLVDGSDDDGSTPDGPGRSRGGGGADRPERT